MNPLILLRNILLYSIFWRLGSPPALGLRLAALPTLRQGLWLEGFSREAFLFVTQKGSEKSLAVPRQPPGGAQRAPPSARLWEPQRGGRSTEKLKNAGVLHFS